MITATVRYRLPPHIDYGACREHFHKIAPGFRDVRAPVPRRTFPQKNPNDHFLPISSRNPRQWGTSCAWLSVGHPAL